MLSPEFLVLMFLHHYHEQYVDVYSFDQATRNKNASMIDAALAYDNQITPSRMILMINKLWRFIA